MNLVTNSPWSANRERLEMIAIATRTRLWETDCALAVKFLLGDYFDTDLDLPRESTIGRTLYDIFSEFERGSDYDVVMNRLRQREPIKNYRYARKRPDGSVVHLIATAVPLFGDDGTFIGYRGVSVNVTAETEARKTAERTSARFAEALAILPDGFAIYDNDDKLVMFNQAYRGLYGEIVKLGKSFREIFETAKHSRQVTNATDPRIHLWNEKRLARSDDLPFAIEEELVDGRWIRNLSLRMNDGGSAELRTDITDLKHRESALRKSEERFHRLFDGAAAGIAVTDTEGRFLNANPAFCEMVGYSKEELGEFVYLSLLHPADQPNALKLRKNLLSGDIESLNVERRFVSKDGRTVWIRNSAAVVQTGQNEPAEVITICEDITRQHEADRKLREQESLLRIAGETADLGGLRIDRDYTVTYSDQALAINGLSADTVVNLENVLKRVTPEHRAVLREDIERCMNEGTPYDREVEFFRAGERRWVRTTATPVRDPDGSIVCIQGSIQDITKYKAALDVAENLGERLENVLEGSHEAFVSLNERGVITHCNTAFERLLNHSRESAIGRSIWHLFPEDRNSKMGTDLRNAVRRKAPIESTVYAQSLQKWLDINAYRTRDGLAIFARDVTEKVELEQQLAHAARLSTMGEMAASLAHEINQPLSAISMAAENAAMDIEAGRSDIGYIAERLDIVAGQVDKLRDIINHVRGFARRDDSEGEVFDPVDAIEDSLKLFESEFKQKNIEVERDLVDSPGRIFGHKVRLEQVIVNIVGNARDAILERTAADDAAPRRIRLTCAPNGGNVDILISDTGGGIPEDVLETLFEPFTTTKKSGEGTGLGMAIALSIIAGMGGTLNAENTDEGARFSICLPMANAQQGVGSADEPQGGESRSATG